MVFKRFRDGCEVNPNEAPWVVYIRNCQSNVIPHVIPDCIPDCTPDCKPDCIKKYTQTDCVPECTPDCTPKCIKIIEENEIEIEYKRQVNLINENLVPGFLVNTLNIKNPPLIFSILILKGVSDLETSKEKVVKI